MIWLLLLFSALKTKNTHEICNAFVVSFLNIYIRSEGCDDPGVTSGTCGHAYIMVNGDDHSLHLRGHNVVVVDAVTGVVAYRSSSPLSTGVTSEILRLSGQTPRSKE